MERQDNSPKQAPGERLSDRLKPLFKEWERWNAALPPEYFRALQQRAFLNFIRNSKKRISSTP
jgi:hypothetical protein